MSILTERQISRINELGATWEVSGDYVIFCFHGRQFRIHPNEDERLSMETYQSHLWPEEIAYYTLFDNFDAFVDKMLEMKKLFSAEEFARKFAINAIKLKMKEYGDKVQTKENEIESSIMIELSGPFWRSICLSAGKIKLDATGGFAVPYILPDYGVDSVNKAAEWLIEVVNDENRFFSHVSKLCQ